MTGDVSCLDLKQTLIFSTKIPCGYCAGAIKKVCARGSHQPAIGTSTELVVVVTLLS